MSQAWTAAERQAARALSGTRNSRGGDFGQSAPDVEHPLFSVEVKYRKQLPRLLRLGLEQATSYDRAPRLHNLFSTSTSSARRRRATFGSSSKSPLSPRKMVTYPLPIGA